MSKRAIPGVPGSDDRARQAFDAAVKENLEALSGLRSGQIKTLASTATTAEIIAKINELIVRLQ